ncbi:hypothetical protein [Streptomyces sp. HUAS ZL42]|uniref:hypothetical protein n=1 Tax=Streptomyces sp. HUAS ZL42 TaxID=3231715 RepID=UPI00345F0048
MEIVETPPAGYAIDPLEIAEALDEPVVSRGRPPITFYGTPKPAPLNPTLPRRLCTGQKRE